MFVDHCTPTIRLLCFELYKNQWIQEHIPEDLQRKAIMEYYGGLMDAGMKNTETYTYEDFLTDVGFAGMCYVCFEEFLEAEYRNEDYIRALLGEGNYLFQVYLKDIKKTESLAGLVFNWDKFAEDTYKSFLKDLAPVGYLGSIHVGDIAIDLLYDNSDSEVEDIPIDFDLYVAHEDTGYKRGPDFPYTYAKGSKIYISSDAAYEDFKKLMEACIKEYIFMAEESFDYSLVEHALRPLFIWS